MESIRPDDGHTGEWVMERSLEAFERLVDAEDFLEFFGIPYDPRVVHVNRLHILKKFALLKEEVDRQSGPDDPETRCLRWKEAMQRAYETFLASTAVKERLFRVFERSPHGLVTIRPNGVHRQGRRG
jgi:nitrogenase-stabilizing/protective protein